MGLAQDAIFPLHSPGRLFINGQWVLPSTDGTFDVVEAATGYIAAGIRQGATLAAGGRRPKHLDRGRFVEPTLFGNVDNSHIIAREEIFGPVLSVIPADNEAHAIQIANDTIYGLNASVFTRTTTVPAPLPANCALGQSVRTRCEVTLASPSGASSSQVSAARVAGKVSCLTSRQRPSSSTAHRPSTNQGVADSLPKRLGCRTSGPRGCSAD